MKLSAPALARSLALGALALTVSPGAHGAAEEWRHWAGDTGAQRYSPLSEIDSTNVERLEVLWSWTVADARLPEYRGTLERATNFESTPLYVDGTLYVTTPLSQVVALDPATGEERWRFDPGGERERPPNLGFVHRGATFHSSEKTGPRLFMGTGDGYLLAIDPRTGEPVGEFGELGRVDLTRGLGRPVVRHQYAVTAPPVVCGEVVVVGASISEGAQMGSAPPGHVRAFDLATGALRWTFHTIPQEGEPGVESWQNGAWREAGHANVWTTMTVDPQLERVYLPTSTPTNDFYGGQRLGHNLFAESLVSLDCASGKRVWHFQITHHGLWDYDLPAAPMLVDLEIETEAGGRREVPAVVQLTKQGFVFVFDRRDGTPVWPIEERPVPASRVPGEQAAATQPFPTRPPPFERQGLVEDDLIDFTPELRTEAKRIVETLGIELGPLYAPPSLEGTTIMPGYGGGANWPGGAFDPESHRLYVPSMASPMLAALGPPDPSRSSHRYVRRHVEGFAGPDGLPLIGPPYSQLTAYDLDRGEILWQVANGRGPRDHPRLAALDLPDLGSKGRGAVLLTRTLLFLTEGSGRTGSSRGGGGPLLRALDKQTGEVIRVIELPGETTGAPMTYRHAGRQYIAVALGSTPPRLIALGLPPE